MFFEYGTFIFIFSVKIIFLDYDDVSTSQHFYESDVYANDATCSKVTSDNVVTQLKKCTYTSSGHYDSDFCIK